MTKIAFVSGAGSGLGRALVESLASQKYTVYAGYRSAVDEFKHPNIIPLKVDVTQANDIADAVSLIHERHARLDLLVNNAAVSADFNRSPLRMGRDEMLSAFATNVIGPVQLTTAFLPLLQAANGAKVAMISSILGSFGETIKAAETSRTLGKSMVYASTKAALNMISIHLRAVLAPLGIELALLHPGWLQTKLGGARAPLTPENGAEFVHRHLESRDSSNVPNEFLGPEGRLLF